MSYLLENLNNAQQQAVSSPLKNLLVLAGAGSGKTRVLVHRIAWLLQQENVSPFSILAVTFTNKAANELRARIEGLLGTSLQGMWVGTFHGLAHRLLRTHWQDANLVENFQILDSVDQLRLIKRVMRELNINEEHFPPKQAQWFINSKKDDGLRAKHLAAQHDSGSTNTYGKQKQQERVYIDIYRAYENTCEQNGLVDFAELLLRSHELWLHKPELLAHYQERFQHILVDEFQDTNAVQYAWIRLLAGKGDKNHIMVVGDDDQSIYSWRGACVDNIHNFQQDFHQVEKIILEQNYRSTSNILNASNAVISFNTDRFGKCLWTQDNEGELINLYSAYNDLDEARYIADQLKQWQDSGEKLSDAAILYRSNAQSRTLEEALLQKNISYRIYGGLRFFERAEIKDALAYLRLVSNPFDNNSFERIINTPPRGLGNKSIDNIRAYARENNVSLWGASQELITHKLLSSRALACLGSFIELINHIKTQSHIQNQAADIDLADIMELVIETSGLIAHYEKDRTEAGRARIENLQELVSAASEFDFDHLDVEDKEQLTPVTAFLAHASLEAGERQAEETQDSAKLMTLHAAKGLEFPLVILCGMEEGLFPHQMCLNDPRQLEEERRLCYVGMTRAMKKLVLTYAESRRLYGQERHCQASRFIREIPAEYLQEVRLKTKISRPVSNFSPKPSFLQQSETGYQIGQNVSHPKFGPGVILDIEPNGEKTRIQIKFNVGTKWLIASMAKLETSF